MFENLKNFFLTMVKKVAFLVSVLTMSLGLFGLMFYLWVHKREVLCSPGLKSRK